MTERSPSAESNPPNDGGPRGAETEESLGVLFVAACLPAGNAPTAGRGG